MSFLMANRTDVACDQNGNEIGWVYITDAGVRLVYYFNGKSKSNQNTATGSDQAKSQASCTVA